MPIQIRENGVAFHLLCYLDAADNLSQTFFSNPHQWVRWAWCGNYNTYKTTVYRLMKAGLIQIIEDDSKKYLRLTKQGKVQILVAKARLPQPAVWDGKWRMVFFDIPEDNKVERQQLRRLLLKNGFEKMQASVYICPWPLNREAVAYLKDTGLIQYIRFGRMEELDVDDDLKKRFHLC